MRSWRRDIFATFLAAIAILAASHPTLAQSGSPPDRSALSPYWWPAISQWESLILPEAADRRLDPDLMASLIWKESLGRAYERGPVGAVGLMGLMPFDWRPSADELEDPWTNLYWGARALAHTIRDGQGDLYYSLAAYNGGWGQIHLRVTRRYAADVLGHYARAVAARYELPADGEWVAVFAVEGAPGPQTTIAIGPQRPLARYTERPWVQADVPAVPVDLPPHATAAVFVDEHGVECRVNVWLITADGSPLASPAVQTSTSSPHLAAEAARDASSP
jgi:hypothetical protein